MNKTQFIDKYRKFNKDISKARIGSTYPCINTNWVHNWILENCNKDKFFDSLKELSIRTYGEVKICELFDWFNDEAAKLLDIPSKEEDGLVFELLITAWYCTEIIKKPLERVGLSQHTNWQWGTIDYDYMDGNQHSDDIEAMIDLLIEEGRLNQEQEFIFFIK